MSATRSIPLGFPAQRPVDFGAIPAYPVETPAWKRALDIVGGGLALLLLAPLMTVVALVMKLVSPGPVLFRQERIGHLGRRFTVFKFRTMHVGVSTTAHEAHCRNLIQSNAPMKKMDNQGDARLIPGGWILRASGLDELPQILNVLRGEMSLVGPRPCLPFEFAQYQPWQKERFNTLPGLTGLWQVSGKNRTTFDEMIRLDIRYARNRSLLGDLGIMAMTVPALVTQFCETRRGRKAAEHPAGR
jgi:lipopolysaccharide/colanic/teichoic acid biosynthesis glycosyltransferase